MFHLVLPSFDRFFYRVLPIYNGSGWILLGFTGFYQVCLALIGFYRVLPSFFFGWLPYPAFFWALPSFCYWVFHWPGAEPLPGAGVQLAVAHRRSDDVVDVGVGGGVGGVVVGVVGSPVAVDAGAARRRRRPAPVSALRQGCS